MVTLMLLNGYIHLAMLATFPLINKIHILDGLVKMVTLILLKWLWNSLAMLAAFTNNEHAFWMVL